MSKGLFYNRLRQLMGLVTDYKYPEPLPIYLRKYFKANKNLGSKDRKQIKEWFYAYFKSDFLVEDLETELIFLLEQNQSAVLDKVRSQSSLNLELKPNSRPFPLSDMLSVELDNAIITNLKSEKLSWVRSSFEPVAFVEQYSDQIYGLEKSAQIETANYDQIQDLASYLASEKVADYLNVNADINPFNFWDACCGSGGKSLAILSQLKENKENIQWYCSDKRSVSLHNAQKRLENYAVKEFACIDLTREQQLAKFETDGRDTAFFDAILFDVPCSGSGTWGRNPQHLRFFTQTDLEKYVQLQQNIIHTALPMLKPGGSLFYVTCSAYSAENENQLAWMQKSFDLELKSSTYLGNSNSDLLFCAQLVKKS